MRRYNIAHAVLLIVQVCLSVCGALTCILACCGETGGGDHDWREGIAVVLGGIRETARGRRWVCEWYASKRIPPTGPVFQPERSNADFTAIMPVAHQGGGVDFFSN